MQSSWTIESTLCGQFLEYCFTNLFFDSIDKINYSQSYSLNPVGVLNKAYHLHCIRNQDRTPYSCCALA